MRTLNKLIKTKIGEPLGPLLKKEKSMLLYKIFFHIAAVIQHIWFKLIYGKSIVFGKKVTWRKRFNLAIESEAKVEIGENCFFNNDCSINAMHQVTIGADTLFGENVKIYDHNHKFNRTKNVADQGYSVGEVSIGRNCWICSNVTILKGTRIEDGCVIGAGCVISGLIPANTIVRPSKAYTMDKIERIAEKEK